MRWFRDLRLTHKFAALLALMLLNVAAVGGVAVLELRGLGALLEESESGRNLPRDLALRIERALSRSRMLLFAHYAEFDQSKQGTLRAAFMQNAAALDNGLHEGEAAFPAGVRELAAGLRNQWEALRATSVEAMALGEAFNREESLRLLNGRNREQHQLAQAMLETLTARLTGLSSDAFEQGRGIRSQAIQDMTVLALLGALVTVALLVFMTRLIALPLRAVSEVVQQVAAGDLTRASAVHGRDEIGALGRSVDVMSAGLRHIVTDLAGHAGTVAASSTQLATITGGMAGKGRTLIEQSASVSGASVELANFVRSTAETVDHLSANIRAISGGAQDTSQRMAAVNRAVEEINGSMARIAGAADSAGGVARTAMDRSEAASGTMRQLGEAAQEIGAVTEAIKRLAHQTNLLALNAGIEAASAGKAGAGFAVVANAIKALARQSAQSAGEIATRITSIQERTEGAVRAISEMSQIIAAMDRSVKEIAAAVSDQGQAAAGITINILEAAKSSREQAEAIAEISRGTQEMAVDLNQASLAASVVSTTIDDVHRACGEVAQGIAQIAGTTTDLARAGSGLEGMVNQFQTS